MTNALTDTGSKSSALTDTGSKSFDCALVSTFEKLETAGNGNYCNYSSYCNYFANMY